MNNEIYEIANFPYEINIKPGQKLKITKKSKETHGQTRGLSNLEMKHVGKLANYWCIVKAALIKRRLFR